MGIILQPCRIVQCDPNKGSSSPARSLCEVTGPKDPTLETLTKKRKSRSLAYLPFKDTVQHFTLFHMESFLRLQYGRLSPPSVFPESERLKYFLLSLPCCSGPCPLSGSLPEPTSWPHLTSDREKGPGSPCFLLPAQFPQKEASRSIQSP